jgi:phage repressor protein C with HTH and peptisase S24 domain
MTPNFHDNDLIICLKYFYSLKEGNVILIKTPALGVIIKRIKNIKEKKILIEGDNKEYPSKSYDHEYDIDQVIGKVIFKFWRF